jgi:transposase
VSLLYRRCAGLDVHKKAISVCVRVGGHKSETESATFGTFTCDLQAMADWLKARKVRHVAMESTGVYFALSSALIGRVQVPPALG